MNNLESGKDKIKKICEILKKESLEPAKQEAQDIIEEAHEEASRIIQEAKQKTAELLKKSQEKITKERQVFESSLNQAAKQAMEALRQSIETQLFNEELSDWVKKHTADPKIAATLINVVVEAIEREGTSADLSAYIPSKLPAEKVNALLAQDILNRLREKSVILNGFDGGIQVKLHDQKLTLDLSDEALIELLERYLRKEFRDLLFKSST